VQLDCALLCDAATVREGLLHILGGGVTHFSSPWFPVPLELTLAVRILLDEGEGEKPHNVDIRLLGDDRRQIGRMLGQFTVATKSNKVSDDEQLAAALPLRLTSLTIGETGWYTLELRVDDTKLAAIPLLVLEAAN
jgi:hypothetical protein